MDGFGANEGIIMIAATNRPDILDPALLRPGRFDRQIVVDRPDIRGRLAILKVHAKGKPIDSNVDMEVLARRTPGFTGADLANLVNEGALLAARHNQMTITMSDLEEAAERVMMGPERRSRVISDNEKRLTAYHEGGHTLVGMLLDHTDPVHKVTIIPRGRAGGYTLSLPKEDRYYATRSELLDELKVLLGGRVAEALVLHEISSGASNDLQRATELARQMTCEYGMSERLGAVTFGHRQQQVFLGRDIGHENMYSEKIAAEIDGEIRRFIDEAYEGTVKLLQDNIDKLHLIAQALIERETLEEHEIKELVEYGRILEKGEEASSKEGSPMDPVKLEGETLPEVNPPSARQEGPLPKDDSQPLG
jgi:cell division protease FtsH